ncbi:MAG TPA: LysR family transcriptional regulator [Granulicella sp.]|nr:LysR family transcriptional regulator [Granulicella sp.]
MIIRNFEYLLALDKERHFARAAAACRVSQPTLSAGIKQLEEDMDVRIVERGRRFEGFTREGERVLAWAQQMLDDCTRLKQELHELRDSGMQGPFRLGMLPATSALASLLSVAFAEKFPALQISMETADPERLLKLLRNGEMDVALMHLDQPAGEGLDAYALYRERMFLFTTAPLTDCRRVSWDDVAALPLCLLRSAVPRSAEMQLEKAAKVIHTDSPAVLAAHVASGRCSTVLPQSLVTTLTRTPALRAIAIAKPAEQVNVGFVTVKCDPLPAPVHALMEMAHSPELVEAIRAMLAAHEDSVPKAARKTGGSAGL